MSLPKKAVLEKTLTSILLDLDLSLSLPSPPLHCFLICSDGASGPNVSFLVETAT